MAAKVDTTKNWVHDCDACTYLGPYKGMDLYACIKTDDKTDLIARFSSEGGDYKSLPMSMMKIHKQLRDEYLDEAFSRFQKYMS